MKHKYFISVSKRRIRRVREFVYKRRRSILYLLLIGATIGFSFSTFSSNISKKVIATTIIKKSLRKSILFTVRETSYYFTGLCLYLSHFYTTCGQVPLSISLLTGATVLAGIGYICELFEKVV